jgi:hypothetical protein
VRPHGLEVELEPQALSNRCEAASGQEAADEGSYECGLDHQADDGFDRAQHDDGGAMC